MFSYINGVEWKVILIWKWDKLTKKIFLWRHFTIKQVENAAKVWQKIYGEKSASKLQSQSIIRSIPFHFREFDVKGALRSVRSHSEISMKFDNRWSKTDLQAVKRKISVLW